MEQLLVLLDEFAELWKVFVKLLLDFICDAHLDECEVEVLDPRIVLECLE